MKKYILTAIKFITILLAILCLIDVALNFGINKNKTCVFAKPNKICRNDDLPQIAIFSSSVGEMGYDCNVLENITHKSVYNFSLTGARFLQYKGMVDELNAVSNKTEIVVLSESIFSFEKLKAINDIERFLPCISNNNVYKSLYKLQPELSFKCRYIPFYKYIVASNNYYLQSMIGWKNYLAHKKNIDSLKGQTKIYRNWEADQDNIWKNAKPIAIKIDKEIVTEYVKTVNELVNGGKTVFIALTPMYLPKEQKIVDLTELRKTLKSIADDRKIFFVDYSETMVDKKYFYNAHHLNAYGAKAFSKMFADSLVQLIN